MIIQTQIRLHPLLPVREARKEEVMMYVIQQQKITGSCSEKNANAVATKSIGNQSVVDCDSGVKMFNSLLQCVETLSKNQIGQPVVKTKLNRQKNTRNKNRNSTMLRKRRHFLRICLCT